MLDIQEVRGHDTAADLDQVIRSRGRTIKNDPVRSIHTCDSPGAERCGGRCRE